MTATEEKTEILTNGAQKAEFQYAEKWNWGCTPYSVKKKPQLQMAQC